MAKPSELAEPSREDIDAVARALETDLTHGLSAQVASSRLQQEGPNELRKTRELPTWRRILEQFQDPLIYLLLVALVIALVAWFAEGCEGYPVDAIVIASVVLLNGILGYVQEAKARDAVAALARMTAVSSHVVRDGQLLRVPSAALVRGDLLVLAEGDTVGADGRLIEATSLRVQEASLTGESEAVLKDIATLPRSAALGDQVNRVFKGTDVVQGSGRALITATGMATELGSIAKMLDATPEPVTPLEKEIERLGRMLSFAVVLIAISVVGTFLLLYDLRNISDLVEVLLFGVALAVAAVPEGLPAILSVVLALGVQRMAKHNAIVKDLASVSTLGSTTVICSDKTGTLTCAEMTIKVVLTASGGTHITGSGYMPKGEVQHQGVQLAAGPLHSEQVVVLSGGSLAGNAILRMNASGNWEVHGDPTEAAFLVAERKLGVTERREQRFHRIGEIPFTSERKLMSTLEIDREHDNEIVITKGAPEILLRRCTRLRVGADVVPLDEPTRERILADVDELTDSAFRTLAVAYRPLDPAEERAATSVLENNLIYVGTVGMVDPPREEAAAAIREARQAGIRVIMITGDHPRTAARIAADLGIADAKSPVLTGLDIDALDDASLNEAVGKTSVYARVAPAHKLRIVDALQDDGDLVAMTGDGVNDAPALKSADIGIAMGVTGTEVTKAAAKMVLADDNFATIVEAVREGRCIFDNIRKFLRYLLSSNMGEVLTVFLGIIGARVIGLSSSDGVVALPLLATQILWINLVTDSAPALAMGVDPMTEEVMTRKPRRLTERVIDARMWAGVLEIGLVIAVVTLLTFDIFLPGGMIEGTHDTVTARTAGFTVLVLTNLFNCFNARSETTSVFHHLFVNPWLWGAIVLSALLQLAVVNVTVLNIAFGTVPLTLDQWLLCISLSSIVLWYSELRKLLSQLWKRGVRRAPEAAHPDSPPKAVLNSSSTMNAITSDEFMDLQPHDRKLRRRLATLVLLLATAIGIYLCYQLAVPFLPPLTWALVLAVTFAPLQKWLEFKLKQPSLAALVSVLVISLTVVVPASFVGQNLVTQAAQGAQLVVSKVKSGEWRATIEAYPTLAGLAVQIEREIDLPRSVETLATWLSSTAGSFVKNSVFQIVSFCLTFYFLFFLLRDRLTVLASFKAMVPLSEAGSDRLLRRVADTIYATIYGMLVVSSLQGLLGGLMFWWLGLATPLLWGVVMALLAIVPVLGAFIVWIPAAVFLLLEGNWGKALTLVLWGVLVVGSIDNLLRPILVANRLKLHTVISFMSVVGGLILFGPAGLILGPVTVTVTTVLLECWLGRQQRDAF